MFTKPKADRLRGRYYFWKSAYVFGTASGNKLHIINWIPYLMLMRLSSSYSVLVITLHWESCYHETHVLYDLYSGTTRRKCICSLQEYSGELIEPYLSQMLLLCNVLSYIMYEKRSKTRIKMYTNPTPQKSELLQIYTLFQVKGLFPTHTKLVIEISFRGLICLIKKVKA